MVDTGALVRGEKLENLAEEFFTIREVLAEVRDKRTRRMLETLPFTLQTKEPSEAALKRVVGFAKQTGDLNVLSKPDIKIMALAYMLHVQYHGEDSLRQAPEAPGKTGQNETLARSLPPPLVVPNSNTSGDAREAAAKDRRVEPGTSWAGIVGAKDADADKEGGGEVEGITEVKRKDKDKEGESFWDDDDFVSLDTGTNKEKENRTDAEKDAEEEWPELPVASEALEPQLPENVVKRRELRLKEKEDEERVLQQAREEELAITAEKFAKVALGAGEAPTERRTGTRILGNSDVYVDSGIGVGDYDDGVGWIDSSNIEDALAFSSWTSNGRKNRGENQPQPVKEAEPSVGCITTDYAMQNVLLQMRLHLISVEGRRVTSVRRFVLKCDACYKICLQLDKMFCPSCGNNTLARLSYSIDKNGVMRYHYKKNRKINLRGSKYSIPNRKPGDKQPQLLLREDQMFTGWWGQQARKKDKSDSMFGEHVAESFGLSLSNKGSSIQVGFGRSNVNAKKGRERRGKKKKRGKGK